MKVTDVLKCAKAGISIDDVKGIQALDNVSVDDAIELIKGGYKLEDLKDLITDEPDPEPEPEPDKKSSDANKHEEENKKLKEELEKTKKDLESAQLANTKKDVGPGEKPDIEEEMIKLFAGL